MKTKEQQQKASQVPKLKIEFTKDEKNREQSPYVPFLLNSEHEKEESVDEQLEEMIGSLPTIKTEKDENQGD